MFTDSMILVFEKDLDRLAHEIKQYNSEDDLWKIKESISNSAGNLCLHIIGNLNHFIGAVLGQSGYIRNRAAEFTDKNVDRAELLEKIEQTKYVVVNTLESMRNYNFNNFYPEEVYGDPVKTDYMLVSLSSHLAYHIGQINYHRRLVC